MVNIFSFGRKKEPRLFEILLESNFLSKENLDEIKQRIENGEPSIEDILLDYISPEVLLQTRVDEFERKFMAINLMKNEKQFNSEDVRALKIHDAIKYRIVVLQKKGHGLAVAMVNPHDDFGAHIVERETGCMIMAKYLCLANDLEHFIQKMYGAAKTMETKQQVREEESLPGVDFDEPDTAIMEIEAEGMIGVRQIVDALIQKAIDKGASDVHIEPTRVSMGVRYRVDGILHNDPEIDRILDMERRDKHLHNAIVNIIKNRSGASGKDMRLDEKEKPQDGRIYIPQLDLDLRVSIIPSLHGESVVVRLHNREVGEFSLDKLGFEADDFKKFSRLIKLPYGMLLVSGPTGSGKTTTLYSVMQIINDPSKKTLTIEDPIEYSIAGAIQAQTNPAKGFTFDKGLRAFLRHDPDIIMVGEIRDPATASMAVESALTGHIVLTTIHANDAVSTIPRLKDLDVDPRLITSTVIASMAQRLVRKNCPYCTENTRYSTRLYQVMNRFGIDYNAESMMKGKGCDLCKHTGYSGRIGIFELMEMTFEMKELILKDATTDEMLVLAKKQGMKSLLNDSLRKVAGGITTEEEVWRVTLGEMGL
ncbi:MAG: GspE/PulE family protein [Candidatus Eremiobacteraeota bacterium]|nr:GspE/PulE family protein [Candidatus Eremiobacteraeota bacterium]